MAISYVQVKVGGRIYSDIATAHDSLGKSLSNSFSKASAKISAELLESINRIYRKLEFTHSSPWGGGMYNPKDTLDKRSGYGLQSILQSIRSGGSGISSFAQLSIKGYMVDHELGATVRPTKSKYLTIPFPAALDSKGLPLRRKARDWGNTFVARSRRGSLIIFQRRGRGVMPLYLLKKQIYIKPRLGAAKIVDDELPFFERRAFEALDRELV